MAGKIQLSFTRYERQKVTSGMIWIDDYDAGKKYLIKRHWENILVGWLFGFYGISNFKGYLMPNPFLYK